MATECPLCGSEYERVALHISRFHTDEEYKSVLLKELERLSNKYDRTLSTSLMQSEGKFSAKTYQINFDSWNKALKEAGLEINDENNISKDRLLEELQRLSNEYNRTPSIPLMESEGEFSCNPYKRVFSSWNKALKEAGLEVNQKKDISKKELLKEIQRLANEYERIPSTRLMTSEGKFSESIYQRKFDSWNEALKQAGFEINQKDNISKDRLLEELQRLDDKYDVNTTQILMRYEGKFSDSVYRYKFGSWNKALKEAGIKINNGSMCGMEQAVYVLECENGKYYVGASANPDKRLREHKNQGRSASCWAREHGVKERIYLSDPMPHEEAYQKEREKTLELMKKHGWKNVRGSCWLSVELESPPEPLKLNQKI